MAIINDPLSRRHAIGLTLSGAAVAAAPNIVRAATGATPPIRALAFDGFTILDVRGVVAAVKAAVPDKGAALASAWTAKLFDLSWLETSAGRYSGFGPLADAALAFAATSMGVELSAAQRADLVNTFRHLPVWPDAVASLEKMRSAGLRLAFLSNLSAEMLSENMRANGLDKLMEAPISTDRVRAFKPAPRAYAMGMDVFRLPKSQIGFVAFGGWDALGAKWFGYRTAWINRLGVPTETLTPAPDATARDLTAALAIAGLAG